MAEKSNNIGMEKIQALMVLGIKYLAFFFTPLYPLMVTIMCLVIADFIMGVKAARKRKEEIHSKGLFRTIEKIYLHFIVIILSRLFELYMIPGIPVTNLVAGFIGVYEFKSLTENYKTITGIDLWKYLSNKIKRKEL